MTSIDPSCLIDTERYSLDKQFSVDGQLFIAGLSNEEFASNLVVVGGGSAGAALAGLIARDQSLRVLLLEAGPDYGHQRAGQWPSDLLDAREIPQSHQWGYRGRNHATHTELST